MDVMDNKPLSIRRVVLRNYKSIGRCDITLRSLTFLVGGNGASKSNFLDALHFVRDALTVSLDSALRIRGGIQEVRRRSTGHPNHFGIRVDLTLRSGDAASYAFEIGALAGGGFEVRKEECVVGSQGQGPSFRVERGELTRCSEVTFPAVTADRLALVAASGMPAFRPVFDLLTAMGFYNLSPEAMRDLQRAQDGKALLPAGENVASVIAHLEQVAPEQMRIIADYLSVVAPMVKGVRRVAVGPMETIEFAQEMAGAKAPWTFYANSMSDGTLRVLGILTALFQRNRDSTLTMVGIEEPETALHPAAAAALRDALRQATDHAQVIVTSHSPDLLDDTSLDPDEVIAVVNEEGETHIAPLDAASRQIMREHLFSAGELLRLDQLRPDRAVIEAPASRQQDLFAGLQR